MSLTSRLIIKQNPESQSLPGFCFVDIPCPLCQDEPLPDELEGDVTRDSEVVDVRDVG